MYRDLKLFQENIKEARNLISLYEYLEGSIQFPHTLDDLLRSEIVNSVSAFDKLIHDVICIGMIEIFTNKRPPTPKYLTESIGSTPPYSAAISLHDHLLPKPLIRQTTNCAGNDR